MRIHKYWNLDKFSMYPSVDCDFAINEISDKESLRLMFKITLERKTRVYLQIADKSFTAADKKYLKSIGFDGISKTAWYRDFETAYEAKEFLNNLYPELFKDNKFEEEVLKYVELLEDKVPSKIWKQIVFAKDFVKKYKALKKLYEE